MPIKSEVTTEQIISYLKDKHGPDAKVDTIDLRAAGNKFKLSYPTVNKRLKAYKSDRGTWDLTALDIERHIKHLLLNLLLKFLMFQKKIQTMYPSGMHHLLKRLLILDSFTLFLLLVLVVTVRHWE